MISYLWLSWRNDETEVFVELLLAILVNDGNCCHEVSVVDLVMDCSHDVESFSLGNDVLVTASSVLLAEETLVFDLEIACVHHVLVLHLSLFDHKPFAVFFDLVLDFIHYQDQERL